MNRLALLSLVVLAACGTEVPGALAAPSGLTVAPLGAGLHLTWKDNSADEEEFAIERRTSGSFGLIGAVPFDTVQFHDEPLTPGTVYAYRVRATKGALASAYSSEVQAMAPGGATGGGGGTGAGGGTGGGAGGGGGGGASSLPDGGYSFQQHVVPVFNRSCGAGSNSCHSRIAYGPTPGSGCRGWLALENVSLGSKDPNTMATTGCPDKSLWQRLTELDGWLCEPTRRKYVVGGSPTNSLLVQVSSGDASGGGECNKAPGMALGRMPPAPAPELTASEKTVLETWILQGAPNN